jgi:hypothetical protein
MDDHLKNFKGRIDLHKFSQKNGLIHKLHDSFVSVDPDVESNFKSQYMFKEDRIYKKNKYELGSKDKIKVIVYNTGKLYRIPKATLF